PHLDVAHRHADVLRSDAIPGRQVYPVAVIDGEGNRRVVDHADEPGLTALVGALRLPLLVGRRDEEHVARLDERTVPVIDPVVHDPLLDSVGEAPGVETVLQLAAGGAVEAHVHIFSGNPHEHQTFRAQDPISRKTERGAAVGSDPFFLILFMAYHVAAASTLEWEDRPPGAEGQQPRRAADVTSAAGLQRSRGRVWRYPAGTRGRR